MTAITAIIAVVFSGLAMFWRPGTALGVVIFSMLIWPEYLRVPLGPVAMSVPRIVALILFVRLVSLGRHKSIAICNVDTLVVSLWVWTVFATVVSDGDFKTVSIMIGRGFDTVMMYIVARLAIQTADDAKSLFVPLMCTAVAMAILGGMEALSIAAPYERLDAYREWQGIPSAKEYRLGFARARVSTSVHIYFGLAMAIITGLLFSVRQYVKSRFLSVGSVLSSLVAALSSMSSGPWLATMMVFSFRFFAKRTRLIKYVIWLSIAMAIALELASNRHFYNLIDYVALNSQTAWYRTRLLEVAVSQAHEYWLFGVGGKYPNHWGALIDGRPFVDVVNHFLIVALYGGFPALIMYVWSHLAAIRRGGKAWRYTTDARLRNMIFSLSATLIALDFACMSVGLFGPPILLSNILLGVLVSSSRVRRPQQQEIV